MSEIIQEIYLKNNRTYLKETDSNGKILFMQSTTKPRMFDITQRGVTIMPDADDNGLNNKEIVLDWLVDKFGATNPVELHEALGLQDFFKKGGGGVLGGSLSESITSTVNEGGIKIGDVFNAGATFQDFAKKFIQKYIAPVFTSFSIVKTGNVSAAVVGQTVTIQRANFNYNLGSDNDTPTNVAINGEGFNTSVANGTKEVILNPFFDLQKNTAQTVNWSLSGLDANNDTITRTTSLTFFNQFLFGASPLELDNSNFQTILNSLANKSMVNSKAHQVTCIAENEDVNNYTYLAYNSAYGDLTNLILDGAAPILGVLVKIGTFNWVNAYGLSVSKIIYKANDKGAFVNGSTLNFS